MARDRKRAKQRRERRGSAAAPGAHAGAQRPRPKRACALTCPARSATPRPRSTSSTPRCCAAPAACPPEAELSTASVAESAGLGLRARHRDGAADDLLQAPALPVGRRLRLWRRRRGGGGGDARPSVPPARRCAAATAPSAFLRASWAELQRVQWPDRRHVTQATAVVLGFVAIAGAYLGLADYVAKEIVEFIL